MKVRRGIETERKSSGNSSVTPSNSSVTPSNSNVKAEWGPYTPIFEDLGIITDSIYEMCILGYLIRMTDLQKSNKVKVKRCTIAENFKCSEKTVKRTFTILSSKGYIKSRIQKGYFNEIEIDIERIKKDVKTKKNDIQFSK